MKCFSCMHSFDLLISEAFADRVVIIRCKTGIVHSHSHRPTMCVQLARPIAPIRHHSQG